MFSSENVLPEVFFLGSTPLFAFFSFPPESIKKEFFQERGTHTTCGWKETASYYTVKINGKDNRDSAWYYPEPSDAAKEIKGYIAFWRGVEIVEN